MEIAMQTEQTGIRKKIAEWMNVRHEMKLGRLKSRLKKISHEKVNVIEFGEEIYLAYNNVPIVPVRELKRDVTKLLPEIRATVVAWKQNHEHDGW